MLRVGSESLMSFAHLLCPCVPQSIPGRFYELETRLDGWAHQKQPGLATPTPPSSEVAPQSKRLLKVPSGLSASLSWCDATVTAPAGTDHREPGTELQAGDLAVLQSWVRHQQQLIRRVSVRQRHPTSCWSL